MPEDRKYGHVTLERGTIGEDEPVFVIRAQDENAVPTLMDYRNWCVEAGSPPHHIAGIDGAIEVFRAWQADHFTQVPRSDPPGGSDG